jgi:hypothetical protein
MMNRFGKIALKMGLLSLLSVMPLAAQIENNLKFTAPFPFYAAGVKLPAGAYEITQPDMNNNVLLIRSTDSRHEAFFNFNPTDSLKAHNQTDVTFHKYGDTGYLSALWVEGQTYGMAIKPSKIEKHAANFAQNQDVVEPATVVAGQ